MEWPARVGLVGREQKCKIPGHHFSMDQLNGGLSGLSEAGRSVLMVTRNSYPPRQHYCGSLPSFGQQSVPSSLVQKMRPARTSLSPRLERSGRAVVASTRRNKL